MYAGCFAENRLIVSNDRSELVSIELYIKLPLDIGKFMHSEVDFTAETCLIIY